jgi:hypothetical protein
MSRLAALFFLIFLNDAVLAAKGNGGASPAAAMQSGQRFGGSGGASARAYADGRNAPPMAPDRKIVEQDCSKPVDLSAGNLKCK